MQKLRFVVVFLFLFASYVGATHIHTDDPFHTHSDCKVCVITKNVKDSDTPCVYVFSAKPAALFAPLTSKELFLRLTDLKGFNATAPPIIS